MKKLKLRALGKRLPLCLLAIVFVAGAWARPGLPVDEKITPEHLIAKHLDSIGTAESRAAVTSRIATGSVVMTLRLGGSGQSQGKAVLASTGTRNLIGMGFATLQYSNETMAFDGKNVTVGQLGPGTRTPLGRFMLSFDIILKEGLLGGVLSSAWPLQDSRANDSRLKYAGTKKIDDRKVYVLNYAPRNTSLMNIGLFFDAESFRHVRTEYEKVVNAAMVTQNEASARQQETRYKLVEEFSDFKKEGALVLPHSYKLQLSINSQSGLLLQDWLLNLTHFTFNEQLDDKQFDATKQP